MTAATRTAAANALSIRTFGSFEVRSFDGALILGPAQRRKSALLKYILSRPRAREAVEVTAGELWPNSTPDAARTNVRGALHAVRSAFAPFGAERALTLEGGTLALDLAMLDIDAFAFEDAAREALTCQRIGLERAHKLATQYAGAYLSGDECERWSCARRDVLSALFRDVLRRALDEARESDLGATLELERRALCELELEPDDAMLALALARRYTETDRRGEARELGGRCVAWGADASVDATLAHAVFAHDNHARAATTLAWTRVESPRFRGRELEVARIGDALDLALDGHGHTVAIFGEAGSGKTRLAGEALAEAQDRGALVFAMTFVHDEPSLVTALSALERLLQSLDRKTYAPLLARALAPLTALLPAANAWYGNENTEPLPHAFEAARRRAAIVRTLEILASAEPLVIFFDDAHQADENGYALVARTIALTDTRALLALVAARGDALEHSPLAEMLDQRDTDITRVDVRALDDEAARELAREVACDARDPDIIAARAAGNPAEIVRRASAGPDHVAQRALEAVVALDERARHALLTISLAPNHSIAHDTLARALDCDDVTTIDVAEHLLAFGAIVERDDGYALAAPEFGRAIARELDADAREAAHARLGELAAARDDCGAAFEHFTQAGEAYREAALRWTDRELATMHYTGGASRLKALRNADALAAGHDDSALVARIALARGRAETAAGSVAAAREALERGYALATDGHTRGRALLELAYLDGFAHRVSEALALCERAREELRDEAASEFAAAVHATRAQLYGALGNVEACANAAAALDATLAPDGLRVTTLNALGSAHLNAGRFDEAESWYERARALALECDLTHEVSSIEGNFATLALRRGRFAQARDAYDRLAREAILDGHLWAAAVRTRNAAECDIYLGDLDRAATTLELAERRAQRTGNPGLIAELHLVRGTLERERGDHARALASLEAALRFFGAGRMQRRELEGIAHALDVRRRAANVEGTRALIERGRALVDSLPDIDEVPYFFATAAAALATLRDTAGARECERRSLDAIATRAPSNRVIETFANLAEARLASGDRSGALAHLARARTAAESFASPRYERAFSQIEARIRIRRT